MTTGQAIKEIRELLGEAQLSFGVRMGVDSTKVLLWGAGQVKPPRFFNAQALSKGASIQ
jgi:DNA-binding transcriptional regulator YiaG